jgi:hypothetical protein
MPDFQVTEATEVLVLDGVLWVPHYKHVDVFVAPGGVVSSRAELIGRGSRIGVEQLWPRPKSG